MSDFKLRDILDGLGDLDEIKTSSDFQSRMSKMFTKRNNVFNNAILYVASNWRTPLSLKLLILEMKVSYFEVAVVSGATVEQWAVLQHHLLHNPSWTRDVHVGSAVMTLFRKKPETLITSFYTPDWHKLPISSIISGTKQELSSSVWKKRVTEYAEKRFGSDIAGLPFEWVEEFVRSSFMPNKELVSV